MEGRKIAGLRGLVCKTCRQMQTNFAEKKRKKPRQHWLRGVICSPYDDSFVFLLSLIGGAYQLLVDDQHLSGQNDHDKRTADTFRLLRFGRSVPVCARQLLKPPCTERYARWCERSAANHRLLLDRGSLKNLPKNSCLHRKKYYPFRGKYDIISVRKRYGCLNFVLRMKKQDRGGCF